jgi:hypothetical protein
MVMPYQHHGVRHLAVVRQPRATGPCTRSLVSSTEQEEEEEDKEEEEEEAEA